MPTPVDIRITPALHADTLKEVDGYDDNTAPLLAPALEALDDAYITLGKLHDARDAAKKNKAWTEEMAVLNVSDAAGKQQQRLAKKLDGVRVTLEKQIAHFEQELSQPLESRAAVTIAGEVRKFVKEMPTEKRHEFLQKAIEEGDVTTCSSVLGAPAYLSGLDANTVRVLTRMWHERMSPDLAQKLKAVRSAKTVIEQRGGLIFGEIEKAMGAKWSKVNELRQGNDKALEALKFSA
ncbi:MULTISPECIES: hypothetical protein [Stenotrophomonas]|jgi:FAD/FMN-containing dehydrogenase|uniref:hypothetical protein n=1 Tax=Stenotrophomonas TaxID=40323 RepID=UPI0015E03194|nr:MULTISPECIES: hypothetical protein [Stenotrophomonas]MBA0352026.1 hypothetical protein [Stenotrophomonas maltophilia]MDH0549606.1 hypothetical protein [Stenotrophomonas sp. GD04006]